ncbi:4-hydroxybenzoate polyprenyltransferase [Synechococcus sp. CS-602]|uniref:4-hydroxybenzoate polyprenyltransferase n=1 Tax=Synechococcaceae TaxID=1890426 RepID=UPI0008FF2C64|nr:MULTISPECIES: 4-hydroxybenzoate polyprenyltransferase [Synechococcaceae]MCT4365530.1 4-hydroxybenzoate polyprenyltransferase [Candidatus Regnicoccus frigidus MAG-AL1]APD47458.1 4-hydroxybenzoate octaprenyltransferase [Synechococcus sp. SynAce01]MCT0202596.1 4-hydroxybenzoate polyprenyltransferase [Synechococcus sp. CS-603]MCT0204400.1 4-hydroxybenzoate polyprenyltransferase [Synechococcus sp. CS-602]MCT0247242.1 4-hydroxybenzoate polyprenyltransferase [Synechococcus sp. CS-601]
MHIRATLRGWVALLRWQKPSGRLILLIPAGWSLWLLPEGPPAAALVGLIGLGGLAVSGAGCVANDLWDRRIDPLVERTKDRPLASGRVSVASAAVLLVLCLLLALLVVGLLPEEGRGAALLLALATLPAVLLYPSAKRWLAFPQLLLAFCWGFAVLIPWAAATGEVAGGWPLGLVWAATLLWTFGFDTVYAMADRRDDAALGLRSSALSLGPAAPAVVAICYGLTALFLALAALLQGVSWPFWPLWALAAIGMQQQARLLRGQPAAGLFGRHFHRQVQLGGLLWLALLLGRAA